MRGKDGAESGEGMAPDRPLEEEGKWRRERFEGRVPVEVQGWSRETLLSYCLHGLSHINFPVETSNWDINNIWFQFSSKILPS